LYTNLYIRVLSYVKNYPIEYSQINTILGIGYFIGLGNVLVLFYIKDKIIISTTIKIK